MSCCAQLLMYNIQVLIESPSTFMFYFLYVHIIFLKAAHGSLNAENVYYYKKHRITHYSRQEKHD